MAGQNPPPSRQSYGDVDLPKKSPAETLTPSPTSFCTISVFTPSWSSLKRLVRRCALRLLHPVFCRCCLGFPVTGFLSHVCSIRDNLSPPTKVFSLSSSQRLFSDLKSPIAPIFPAVAVKNGFTLFVLVFTMADSSVTLVVSLCCLVFNPFRIQVTSGFSDMRVSVVIFYSSG